MGFHEENDLIEVETGVQMVRGLQSGKRKRRPGAQRCREAFRGSAIWRGTNANRVWHVRHARPGGLSRCGDEEFSATSLRNVFVSSQRVYELTRLALLASNVSEILSAHSSVGTLSRVANLTEST